MNVLSLIVLLGLGGLPAGSENHAWNRDYGAALQSARQQQKPLLVLIERRGNEQPAAATRPVSRQADAQIQQLLDRYELCYVDADSNYGRQVAQGFRARTFPFVAVVDKHSRRQLWRAAAPNSSEGWAALLTRYQTGEAPAPPPQPIVIQPSFSRAACST